ncbi:MAG: 50S ribosomal protein L24 [Candidatus Thorarchaeota archaeon]|nr:50S ribosomal protein L24 [Candidatus Thorarchaeota archaeon]
MTKDSPKSPSKQRKRIHQGSIHSHKNMFNVRLDEFLREEYGLRSMKLKKGDLVKIMRGRFRETEGTVERLDYKEVRVYLDSATTEKADGTEINVPIHPSNLMLLQPEMDDEREERIEKRMMRSMESE